MKTPHDALEACWDLPADPGAVGKARRLAREALAVWGVPVMAEDVTTIVSELVTNAIVHGRAPVTLSLHRHGRIVCGEVADHSAVWPTSFPAAGPDEEHGRGLAIVAAYADRWGVEPVPGGKIVWFICVERGSR